MWGRLKIKWPWILSFLNKEVDIDTKKIISRQFKPEKKLTGDDKILADALKRDALVSEIMMTRTVKFGGCGICVYCGKQVSNKAFHEERCPQRHETARINRG